MKNTPESSWIVWVTLSAKNGKASMSRVIQKYLGADFDQTRECNDAAAFLKYEKKNPWNQNKCKSKFREIKINVNQNFVKSRLENVMLHAAFLKYEKK